MPTLIDEERWTRETLRLYRRYQEEIVEACGLCPWAVRARLEGRVRERALLQREDTSVEPSLDALLELAHSNVDVALLIYPRLGQGRAAFELFAARVREADVSRWPLGQAPFVCAVFHPAARADATDPERLIPFLRRTPDPTLQFLRASVLDRVRNVAAQGTQFVDPRLLHDLGEAPPPLREQIARQNLATAERLGLETLTRPLDEIDGPLSMG
jgi:hypothetical protein